jgi:acetyl esterase
MYYMDAATDNRLDPEVHALLAEMRAANHAPLESLPPGEARQAAIDGLAEVRGEPAALASVENLTIPGPLGSIPIRVYRPEGTGPLACMMYFHGGGWVVCDLDTHDSVCRLIAKESGAIVIAVDYRLAPEHKFPAAVVDSYFATCWVAENAARLGVDPSRIAVGGDSAGGNLSAVLSLKARDENGPPLALQVLIYPVTNLADFGTESYIDFAQGYHLSLAAMEWFRDHYLARPEDALSIEASPLFAKDLSGLPPALVITAECDVLRDEGEAYAERLRAAGVAVKLTRYAGMIHPFFSMPGRLKQARAAIAEVAAALQAMSPLLKHAHPVD